MMLEESHVGDTTVRTCRKQISCKCKWRYSHSVLHFCSMQRWVCSLQTGPLVSRSSQKVEMYSSHVNKKTGLCISMRNSLPPNGSIIDLSCRNGTPPWEERDNEGDFFAVCCGQKSTHSWARLPGECRYSCRTGKRRRRWQLASKLQWGVTSARRALWQQWPWHVEHGTAEVAGRQQRSLTLFIWGEMIK